MKHIDFLKRLPEKREYEILEEFVNVRTKILIKNKFGLLKVHPNNLIRGCTPSIESAVNKTSYFIEQVKQVHGDLYDYSKVDYILSSKKIIIICKQHGEFYQTPHAHLLGQGCKECKRYSRLNWVRLTNEKFLKKVSEVHGDKYSYPNLNINDNKTKIEIECKTHGIFLQSPNSHMRGRGCRKCILEYNTYKKEDYIKLVGNKKVILYHLRIFNEFESFIKIGITSNTIAIRYNNGKRLNGYSYEILQETIFDKAEEAFDKELELKRKYKNYRYSPKIKFKGSISECFTLKILENGKIYKR